MSLKTFCALLSPETSAAIHSHVPLWPGQHNLQVEVLDAQGLSCPTKEVFTVNVCTCSETEDCSLSLRTARLETTSSKLATPAIGLLLLAFCLLLCELILEHPLMICITGLVGKNMCLRFSIHVQDYLVSVQLFIL